MSKTYELYNESRQKHNNKGVGADSWFKKYINTALASGVELTIGQPLDRLKIQYQIQNSGNMSKQMMNIKNWKYWYAGIVPSAIQRCGIYFPGIKLAEVLSNNMIDTHNNNGIQQCIFKPFIVSAIVTPYVTLFDAFKNYRQQLTMSTNNTNNTNSTNNTNKSNNISKTNLLGIWKERGTRSLMRAWFPTFSREYCFIGGMLILQPNIYNYMNHKIDSVKYGELTAWIVSSLMASVISQMISQPLDVWKTNIEINSTQSIWKTMYNITFSSDKTESKGTNKSISRSTNMGRTMLLAGLIPRVIRGAWTFGCINAILSYLSD